MEIISRLIDDSHHIFPDFSTHAQPPEEIDEFGSGKVAQVEFLIRWAGDSMAIGAALWQSHLVQWWRGL